MVDPTSPEETLEILTRIKGKYEKHHSVRYTDEAIHACVKLTDRYITDRFLPDKAIDALDEAGARVHLSNIRVPQHLLQLEEEIEKTSLEKNLMVKKQRFEDAARLRDKEKRLMEDLEAAQTEWEKSADEIVFDVTDDDVARVVAMMTGIPVVSIGPLWMDVFPYGPDLFEGHDLTVNATGEAPRVFDRLLHERVREVERLMLG
jgi:ATP-dependent Clp protease ATP-binding subunit ClpC